MSAAIIVPGGSKPTVGIPTPGPPGAMGHAGPSTVQRVAAAPIAFGTVCRTTTNQALLPATTDPRRRPFAAIALGDVGTGSTGNFHVIGPVPIEVLTLGAGVACAVGIDVNGMPVRATDPECVSAPNWVGSCDERGIITMAPVLRGFFDPIDFGAVADGLTDDLPAFRALHDALPTTRGARIVVRGDFYLSDTWRVSKQVRLMAPEGQLDVAAGRAGIRLDGSAASLDGNSSDFSVIDEIKITSRILIHGTANGSSLGRGIVNFWNSADALRKNDCVIASSGHTDVFFRCTDTGNGTGIGTLTAEPPWNYSIGGVTISEGLTFVTESLPTVRANLTGYTLGQRVFAAKDNRVVWECTVAGTTAAAPPVALAGGDAASGLCINGTYTDGTVTWLATLPTGLLIASTFPRVRNAHITNFTGPGISFIGGIGQLDGAVVVTDCNFWRCTDPFIEYCGVGVYGAGDNSNGWHLIGLSDINIGTLLPTPNAALAAGYTNLGGHSIHDATLAGGAARDCYFQLSTGRAVLKTGLGRTVLKSIVTELDSVGGRCVLKNGAVWIDGGNLSVHASSTSAIVYVDPNGDLGRGLRETDANGARTLKASMLSQDGTTAHAFSQGGDPAIGLGWKYDWAGVGTGWWGLGNGPQNGISAIAVSEVNAAEGPGLWADVRGHFEGLAAGRFWHGADENLTSTQIRGGSYAVGDRWDVKSDGQLGSYTQIICKTSGFRGAPWQAAHFYQAVFATWGIFGEQVEPTAHDPVFPTLGGRVFRCTTSGTSAGVEPNWAAAPNTNDTIVDGGVTWTNVGTVAQYNVIGLISAHP